MKRTKDEALNQLLSHTLHEEIAKKIGGDKANLTKDDCERMAKNINHSVEKLDESDRQKWFGDKHIESIRIKKETIYSWIKEKGGINNIKNTLLEVFFNSQEQPNEVIQHLNLSSIHANSIDLKNLEGKTYWSYNRMMGASDFWYYGGKKYSNNPDEVVMSLFTFGKVRNQTIKVRRKTSIYKYEGVAYIKGNIMYMDLEDENNTRSFEKNSYMGRIDNLHNLNVIHFIRLCLVNNEPHAVRLIMVEANDVDYDTRVIKDSERCVNINTLGNDVKEYLNDKSNVILTTTPLKTEDILARSNTLYTHIAEKWSLASLFFKEYINLLDIAVESDEITIDALDQSIMVDFYSKVFDSMNEKHKLYATSLPSKNYIWKSKTMIELEQSMKAYIERGGEIKRYFFVRSLNIDSITEEEAEILTIHYKLYGNIPNNQSAVYLINQKALTHHQSKLIAVEKEHNLLSWEIYLGNTSQEKNVADRIQITRSKLKSKKNAAIFDYFEACEKKEGNLIVKKLTDEDIAFWKEKHS